MSRPLNEASVENQAATGAGESFSSKGHVHVRLFVHAADLDSANDTLTVALEHSPRGQQWETLGSVSETDFSGEVASVAVPNVAVEQLRANVTAITDAANGDLSVTAYVMAAGNPGHGQSGTGA